MEMRVDSTRHLGHYVVVPRRRLQTSDNNEIMNLIIRTFNYITYQLVFLIYY